MTCKHRDALRIDTLDGWNQVVMRDKKTGRVVHRPDRYCLNCGAIRVWRKSLESTMWVKPAVRT